MNALLQLAEQCEQAAGPDRELDWRIADATGHPSFEMKIIGMYPPFAVGSRADKSVLTVTSSIDAAITLIPEGWNWQADTLVDPPGWFRLHAPGYGATFEGTAATPALALCAAALRARASQSTPESSQ